MGLRYTELAKSFKMESYDSIFMEKQPAAGEKKLSIWGILKKISVTTGLPGNAVTLTGVSVSHALSSTG